LQPSILELELFDPYSQIPACPGHSEDHGRTIKHIFWEVSEMGMLEQKIVNERMEALSNFPGLLHFHNGSKQSFVTIALKENHFTATEVASARSIIVFALLDLVSLSHQLCWLDHVEYAAGLEFTL